MTRAYSQPIFIDADRKRHELERVRLGQGNHDEQWLQALIHERPYILPVSDIEPGFGDIVPGAREVPCGHGFIDNLYLTPSGDIVIVETKLWRNSQMRREVVAQLLDYVAALSRMNYDAFEAAVSRGQDASARIYDLVRDHPEALDEPLFVDAVANNLRRGRMLAIVLGDGIRTETEALADLLQGHAGAHFTFALVELAVWKTAKGERLIIPGTLAKTVMIERGIVRVERGDVSILPVPKQEQIGAQSISSANFWDAIAKRDPVLPGAIKSFLAALEPLGVYAELKASLNIKADLSERKKPINFGYITKNGQFWTNPVTWDLPEHIWHPYLDRLAKLIDGNVVTGSESYVATTNSKSAPRISQFLPRHQDGFTQAIETVLRALNKEDNGDEYRGNITCSVKL
ncbi:PDDEXK family nuclease [Brucella intermedia]|uniref:hypothetical protein n=1 Tax=Brucella intermedia TaxID=94625 RepID=UPI00224AA889|nr:hypothetical protein [Brucella intermedia]